MIRAFLSAITLALLTFLDAGCNDVRDPVKPNHEQVTQALASEWKMLEKSSCPSLIGTAWRWDRLRSPLVSDDAQTHTLRFKMDGTLMVDEYRGTYEKIYRGNDIIYKINIADFIGTSIGKFNSGKQYETWQTVFPKIKSFSLQGNELTLFYNDDKDSLVYIIIDNLPGDDSIPITPGNTDSDQRITIELVFIENFGVDFNDAAERLFKEKYEAEFDEKVTNGIIKDTKKYNIIAYKFNRYFYGTKEAYTVCWIDKTKSFQNGLLLLDPFLAYAIDDDGNLYDVKIRILPSDRDCLET